ncbi:urease accessory protein D-like isoform X2 [Pomacea canaliculata]|uniref:urease accessory protein D-like isoform X2 n=1 Tax=Pomacea canaliculata TaxID=400727 RepID=UPI000D7276E7|nr:urease accessory protein D-like isoform X2 [Pomacea canaliculata]
MLISKTLKDDIYTNHHYQLKILAPEHAGLSVCRWIYPVNFGGGLVGGDHIDITVSLGDNCAALVTTQESTKVYHCRDAQETQQNMEYFLHGTTFLAILGDPVVCFADAQFCQTQKVYMSEDSNIVLLDWLTAGRVALEEIWNFKSYQSLVEVYIDKHLVFKDNQRLSDGPYFTLREAMGSFQVLGMCVVLGDRMHNLVDHVKQLYGTPHSIGKPLSKDLICSYSPLTLECNNKVINGCYIRFVATSTTLAYSVVQQVTSCLVEILGGDPFRKKY